MADVERSKLLNKHIQDRKELEKDVKKKKGAHKEAAQEKLDALLAKQAEELAAFDAEQGTGAKPEKKEEPKEEVAAAPPPVAGAYPADVRERNWNGLSKTE